MKKMTLKFEQIYQFFRAFIYSTLFYKQRFFSTQHNDGYIYQATIQQKFMKMLSNTKLFKCCLIYITIIILRQIFIFSTFVSMPRPRSVYVVSICDLFFIYSLIFFFINRIPSLKQPYLFFVYFVECLFWIVFGWLRRWRKRIISN